MFEELAAVTEVVTTVVDYVEYLHCVATATDRAVNPYGAHRTIYRAESEYTR